MKQSYETDKSERNCVAPCTGAWIETRRGAASTRSSRVAPCTGAWIETSRLAALSALLRVAPCTGAWIETLPAYVQESRDLVAPCTGAWIETFVCFAFAVGSRSHPVRVRGLKRDFIYSLFPFADRTLYGCVDAAVCQVRLKSYLQTPILIKCDVLF